nr:reverse transcriptase domain-containing protein [Tanacetum cinerariifolium]
MFKQLHLNITLAEALVLMPKYQKMLKALFSNTKKLQKLANTPLNENCSAVILKKLPEKLGDPGKFLIPCGFSELKCKALVDLGASINLMPLSVSKKLGLPDLIPTRMTLELANRAICTPFPTPPLACLFFSLRATVTSSKQKVENSNFEEHLPPVATMTYNRTMPEMLRAPTEGYAEAIVVSPILAEQFELKHSLINMMTLEQFFGLEKDNPHDHIRWGSLPAWERYKDLLRACPHHGFTEFHQLDTFYNALNPADQDSLNAAAGGNLLEKSPQDALMIIENKSKVCHSRSKPIASPVNACDINSSSEIAKLTHVVNQQTSVVTTAMTAMLKQLQANPPPAQVKAVKEICVTCGGAHPYYQCLAAGGNTFPEFRDNIQGYISAAAGNYNQGNHDYHPNCVANQIRPPGFAQPNVQNNQNLFGQPQGFNCGNNFNQEQPYQATAQSNQNFYLNELEKIKRMNDVSIKAMQTQIDMMNTASTSGSGSLPGNTVANPKGELKAITTRSGLVTNGPTVPTPPKSVTPYDDECV